MRFQMKRSLGAGAGADPNPRGTPTVIGSIPDEALFVAQLTLRNSDTIPGRLLFALEGTATNTVVVDVWALDDVALDRQASAPKRLTQDVKELREFYLVDTVTVTVGELTELAATASMPGPGTIYVQVTTGPAAAAFLKVAAAN